MVTVTSQVEEEAAGVPRRSQWRQLMKLLTDRRRSDEGDL
jgi:hypothetical protein